ncbi:MAG: FAD-dependent oxidoreductase [Candidatus Shapirobacteria bacterium]|nr:FAD-dependent oxidoreductase [Candidatus Shapirobacteria bacterium]
MVKKKIAIVGGGITGLYLAYRLSPSYQVTIFEKDRQVGGLISGFKLPNWDWSADNFYHHFFDSDKKLINLLEELSVTYFFKKPVTAIWQNNKLSAFSSPKDLILFPGLNLFDKLRLGVAVLSLKTFANYHLIPDREAIKIFPILMGQSSYRAVWEPLMRGKFGSYHNQVSAVWLWGRIKKRSAKLGYPQGGFSKLIEQLAKKIVDSGGQIKVNQPIKSISQLKNFNKVIFTTPKAILDQITNDRTISGKKTISYLASLNLVLSGHQPIIKKDLYWLNIADPACPFVAIINQAGLVKPCHHKNNYLTYIGGYYRQDDPVLAMSANDILAKFNPFIKKINPNFKIKNYQTRLNKYLWAQPIVTPGYQESLPPFKTKKKNTYLVNMEQIYPWDRGVNYAIELADNS